MKFASSILALVAATALAAPAAPTTPEGVVAIPIQHTKGATKGAGLSKRSYSVPIQNQIGQYVATFQIGTPGQTVQALIDTGSSDLWVYTPASGETDPYNSAKSSTYKFVSDDFSIQYVSGAASGDWVTDTVDVAGASVKNQQFGAVSTSTDTNVGILGIGFELDESAQTEYSNYPASLKSQGLISTNAYSLYLDNIAASTGTLLFGGIDTKKYSGSLTTVKFNQDYEFAVTASVSGISGSFSAVLDSGTSLSYVPQKVVSSIASTLGAKWNNDFGAYTFTKAPTKSVTYKFGAGSVTVPPSELAIPASDFGGPEGELFLTILPNSQTDGINLLGDSFLRSAYVVYNLDKQEAQIGQASYSSSSHIVAI